MECVLSALLWWLIPIVATALALAWAALRARPSRQPKAQVGLSDRERFREAMERPLPPTHPDARSESSRD
jgi:hypothetical protein